MNFLKYYIGIFIITGIGILLAIFLLPTEKEISLMYMYDRQYDIAYQKYQSQYEKGDRSVGVVVPLANIKEMYLEFDDAIGLLKEFSDSNLGSVTALKYLANTYLSGNRFYDYLKTLEKINEIEPSQDILREMAKYYGMIGERSKEIKTLEEIVENFKPTIENYLLLSYRYAENKQLDKATATMDLFLKVFSIDKIELGKMEFILRVLAFQQKVDLSYKLAKNYYEVHPSIETMEFLANTLHNAALYKQARKLLDLLPADEKNDPKIVSLRINILLAQKLKFLAYKQMLVGFAADNLPIGHSLDFLILAVEYEDTGIIDKFLNSKLIDEIDENSLIRLAANSFFLGKKDFLKQLINIFGEKFLKKKKSFSTILAIIDPDYTLLEKNFLEKYYNLRTFSNSQKVVLANIFYFNDDFFSARSILSQVDSVIDLSNDDLEIVIQLYHDLKLQQFGFDVVNNEYLNNRSNLALERAWIILASALGKEKEVLNWLNEERDFETIKDVFHAAYLNKRASLSLYLAKLIFEVDKSQKSKIFMAEAWVLNGYMDKAYELLKKLKKNGVNVLDPYIQVLIAKSKEDESFLKELKEVVFDLVNDASILEKTKREVGYLLIDNNMKEEANYLFVNLAADKNYFSDDVQMLLWLWEDDLDDKKVNWIGKRSKEFEGDEKAEWLQYLVWNDKQSVVIDLVDSKDMKSDKIVDIYLEALIKAKEEEKAKEVLAYLIPEEGRLPRLKKFGKLTYEHGLIDQAKEIYKKVLSQDSLDPDALLCLGELYFSKSDYSEAEAYIKKYLDGIGGSYIANFLFAEIHRFYEKKKLAKKYYCEAIRQIEQQDLQEVYPQLIKANSLHQLGKDSSAKVLYANICASQPDDFSIKADFVNFLMDIGDFDEANNLLFLQGNEGDLNFDIARLRYYQLTLQFNEAETLSDCLLKKYPDNYTVMAVRADLENVLGRWRHALSYITNAIEYAPENQGYLKIRNNILWRQASNVKVVSEYRETGINQKEYLSSIFVNKSLTQSQRVEIGVGREKIELLLYAGAKDNIIVPVEKSVYKVEVNYLYDFWSGNQFTASLYYNDDIIGVGTSYLLRDYWGKTLLILEYRRSNWDYTQTVIEDGTRDMVALHRNIKIIKGLELNHIISYNFYNLKSIATAATSLANELSISYALQPYNMFVKILGEGAYISINYNLDSEIKKNERTRKDLLNITFIPIPLTNREVHTLTLFSSKKLYKFVTVEGYGGYNYDRELKGKCTPVYGANIFFGNKQPFKGSLVYSHSSSTQSTIDVVDSFMVDLYYAW